MRDNLGGLQGWDFEMSIKTSQSGKASIFVESLVSNVLINLGKPGAKKYLQSFKKVVHVHWRQGRR